MQTLSNRTKLRLWVLAVGATTLIIGAAYTMVQQSTRLAAEDLPLSTAQTIKHELTSGAAPADVIPSVKTDLNGDSTVFAIITDNTQHILASSAQLSGQTPLPPSGVFSYTAAHGSDHFTWQPVATVRLATQVLPYGSGTNAGFIITGQSLSQAESRIGTYGIIALAGWVGVIAWTTLLLYWPPRLPAASAKTKK